MRVLLFLIVFLFVGAGVLWLLPEPEPIKSAIKKEVLPTEAARGDIRNVTPDDTLPGPKITKPDLTRLPAIKPPQPKKQPPKPKLWHKPLISKTGFFESNNRELQFKGIKPLALDAQCKAENGKDWPCGRFARTAMRKFVRGRSIECDPVETQSNPIVTDCRVAGKNIAQWLVLRGWAEDENGQYKSQMNAAQQQKVGKWREAGP